MGDITKKFGEGARRIITTALLCAKDLGHTYVGSEHLLLGLLKEDCVCSRLLFERGIDYSSARSCLVNIVGMGSKTILTSDDMTPVCRRIILRSAVIAGAKASSLVGTEHLFSAMLAEECVAVRIITELGGDSGELSQAVAELFFDSSEDNDYYESEDIFTAPKPTPLLDANAIDLTEKARSGKIDPVIGRENEEERMIAILLRRSKNNPCLVGEAGVGKTAVVEALASRIASGDVPNELKNKRIMSLELSMVVAGTKYRGEFEEKIKNIIDEVKNSGNVILFIDEIHTIVGAGGAEGAIDASNIFKPALARGEIRLIGATTLNEYRESIEKDKALERRFQPITVSEPNEEECRKMLRGIRKKYEAYHGVAISDEAIDGAIRLSIRYIPERSLPDKAIDLIDEAAAVLKMGYTGKRKPVLTENEIAAAAEKRTGIPMSVINSDEREKLMALEERLGKRIIGQEKAVKALSEAVRRGKTGIRQSGRPIASFLFLGKAGVGKTECAKALAEEVFDNRNSFIKVDMSELSEGHSISKLVGSPPGYAGFGEGGALTEKVRRNPYSLVLFDEIDKAHPDVLGLLLQILDEGRLTDSAGLTVSFDNTIVIMTANQGAGSSVAGFGSQKEDNADKEATKIIAPELADRVDEIIMFKSLGDNELCRIADIKINGFCKRLGEMGINAVPHEGFSKMAVESAKSKSPRAVARLAVRLGEEAVSRLILENSIKKEETAVISIENGRGIAKIKEKIY